MTSRLHLEVEAAARAVKREYNRRYRLEHPEAYKAGQQRYRRKHRAKLNAAARDYRRICSDTVKAAQARWVAKNPNYFRDRRREKAADYRKGGKYHVPYSERLLRYGWRAMARKQGAVSL